MVHWASTAEWSAKAIGYRAGPDRYALQSQQRTARPSRRLFQGGALRRCHVTRASDKKTAEVVGKEEWSCERTSVTVRTPSEAC